MKKHIFFLKNLLLKSRCLSFVEQYFLENLQIIDEFTQQRKLQLRTCMSWPERIMQSLETWPHIMSHFVDENNHQITCDICNKRGDDSQVRRVLLYGQPYNENSMRPIQPNSQSSICAVSGQLIKQ